MAQHTPVREVGVGLISIGWMGRLHTRAYQSVPSVYPDLGVGVRLLHAADTAADRVDYARDVLGYARGSADYRAVLADPEVDVVSICAPTGLHEEIGVAAAEAGKAFWIEKPVGRSAEETGRVAEAARKAGVVTSIGYNYRGAPAVERARDLVLGGELGRVTNVRATFFASYAAEPKGALSWRFRRDLAGAGALGDLLSHVIDLVQYTVGPLGAVNGLTSTVHAQRPILPMGVSNHFAVIEDGEMGDVENDDYVSCLARFAPGGVADGAIATLEASRTVVGPQNSVGFEIYGTEGSVQWNFERMNELKVCLTRSGANHGYATVLSNAAFGDYRHFQPGPANSMGYDDLKVIEGRKFLEAYLGGPQRQSTIEDALAAAEVVSAVERSSGSGAWEDVPAVPGARFGRTG